MPTDDDTALQDHAAAYHEAGHVIVARACGWQVTGASVTGDGGGLVTFRSPRDAHTPAGLARHLAVDFAGGAAEDALLKMDTRDARIADVLEVLDDMRRGDWDEEEALWETGHLSDTDSAAKLVDGYGDPYDDRTPELILRDAWDHAAQILADDWESVAEVAIGLRRLIPPGAGDAGP